MRIIPAMRWLVALMMFVTGVLHTPGHSFAFSGDNTTIAAISGDVSPEGGTDTAGCHYCTCVQVVSPAVPANVLTPFAWQTEEYSLTHGVSPAEVGYLPPPRPPRA